MVYIEDNGEPGCNTAIEVNQRYRNFEDPTSYWQCGLQGEPAKAVRCEPNKLYSEVDQKCIDWKKWQWVDPKEPLSRPSKNVALLLSCAVVIATAAIVPLDDSSAPNATICKYQNELWGSEDGTKFYFCLTENNTAIEQKCPNETFFVRNATLTGCVPNDLMDQNCVNNVTVGNCTGVNLQQPQASTNPDKFYLCTSEGADPLELSCAEGKAFIKQDGYVGCFNWTQWRVLRQCNTLTNQI